MYMYMCNLEILTIAHNILCKAPSCWTTFSCGLVTQSHLSLQYYIIQANEEAEDEESAVTTTVRWRGRDITTITT